MFKIALKDLRIFFGDKRGLLMTLAVPIALITLFTFAFGGAGRSEESSETEIIVADEDNSDASKRIISELDSLEEFKIISMPLDSAENLVIKGDEALILVINKGLSDSIALGNNPPFEFKYDAAKKAEVGILQGALIGDLMSLIGTDGISKRSIEKFDNENPDMDSLSRAQAHADILTDFKANENGNDEFIKSTPLIAEKENSPALIHSVAGTAVMMLLFAVVAMGASILDEKQEGTLKKLLYSPIKPNSILLGKMIATNVVSVFQLVVMFLFAFLVFDLDILNHLPALALMIFATAFACSSFGVFLASFAKTRQAVQSMSTLVILVMSCIGGSMIPSFMMPDFMQNMAIFSVNYWSIQGFYDIFWRDLSLIDSLLISRISVLILIGALLNIAALILFKRNAFKIS